MKLRANINNGTIFEVINIKIFLYLLELNKSELAWSTESNNLKKNNSSFEVIYENDILKPWKLILKK